MKTHDTLAEVFYEKEKIPKSVDFFIILVIIVVCKLFK